MNKKIKSYLLIVALVMLLFSLAAGTYAWFTSNRTVDTSRATAKSGTANVELQISSYGGDNFVSSDRAQIVQVNNADREYLLPVTTADCKTFSQAVAFENGYAVSFKKLENEENIYHGRIYIRALAAGDFAGKKMYLYLDESEKPINEQLGGLWNKAARLGLSFDGGSAIILRGEENTTSAGNTKIDGNILTHGKVVTYRNGSFARADDPSVNIADCVINTESIRAAVMPLAEIEMNKIYSLDIFVYLEGCDPDCDDRASFSQGNLNLAFYGIIN